MIDTLINLIPYILTLLATLIPAIGIYLKKFARVQKELSDVLTVTKNGISEITDVVVALADGFADGTLTKEEAQRIADEARQVKPAIEPLGKEWKEMIDAIKDAVKK